MSPVPLVVSLPGAVDLGQAIALALGADRLGLEQRRFPDGETYLRLDAPVAGREVVIAAALDRPDDKLVALYLLAATLGAGGATRRLLAAPYLPYMRQDRAFHQGESVSARHIAGWLSACLDGLVTVDPHLHRIHRLDEVYRMPTRVVAAAPAIAQWIGAQVAAPFLIGPDEESAQWVGAVARLAGCPHTVLHKVRRGDRQVEVSLPDAAAVRGYQPVLVDDIVSTAATLAAAATHLRELGLPPPVCLCVHAIFAGDAMARLRAAGVDRVVSGNTVAHDSNAIDLRPAMAAAVAELLEARP